MKLYSVFIKTVEIHDIAQKFCFCMKFLKKKQFCQILLIALYYVLPKFG